MRYFKIIASSPKYDNFIFNLDVIGGTDEVFLYFPVYNTVFLFL